MKIKGSGDSYYTVDLVKQTCSCKDWACRRHNFPIGDSKRLCKHIKEAIDLNSHFQVEENSKLDTVIHKSELDRLSGLLDSETNIIRYSLCVKDLGNSNKELVLLLRLVDNSDNYIRCLSKKLCIGNSEDGIHYIYNGDHGIKVLKCTPENYLFRRLAYSLSNEELVRLSSISFRKLGYKLTENGFIDNNNKLVDIDIYSDEEFCELLGIEDYLNNI